MILQVTRSLLPFQLHHHHLLARMAVLDVCIYNRQDKNILDKNFNIICYSLFTYTPIEYGNAFFLFICYSGTS